jgi:hypothetical protein
MALKENNVHRKGKNKEKGTVFEPLNLRETLFNVLRHHRSPIVSTDNLCNLCNALFRSQFIGFTKQSTKILFSYIIVKFKITIFFFFQYCFIMLMIFEWKR